MFCPWSRRAVGESWDETPGDGARISWKGRWRVGLGNGEDAGPGRQEMTVPFKGRPFWEFPGGPGVRTPRFHLPGPRFDPWSRN